MTRATAMLAAAVCACVLLVLPGTALAGNGKCVSLSPGVVAEAVTDESRAADLDSADRPDVGVASVKHATKKPRRSNRRLRVRGRDRLPSGSTRCGTRAAETAHVKLKRKRHMGKRSLMRRLMKVRGGLQA